MSTSPTTDPDKRDAFAAGYARGVKETLRKARAYHARMLRAYATCLSNTHVSNASLYTQHIISHQEALSFFRAMRGVR